MPTCSHTPNHPDAAPIIDIRGLACARRRGTIFAVFNSLEAGEKLELVNDHDPLGLRGFLDEAAPGGFEWDYRAEGPEEWRVVLTRL